MQWRAAVVASVREVALLLEVFLALDFTAGVAFFEHAQSP